MDILLDDNGDLHLSEKGDISIADSVRQQIRIRLLWILNEWKWNKEEGMPYFDTLLTKNPDISLNESLIREKIFEVEDITEVKEIEIKIDNKSRKVVIRYTASTDFETITEEVKL